MNSKIKTILGIETSCDETGAAVLEKKDGRIIILSNIVSSSAKLQSKYGGIIPEQAAREQIKVIIPVIKEALYQANIARHSRPDRESLDSRFRGNDIIEDLDAIAVTFGPGLIGSLLVGVETAKTLSLIWKKPLVPINHLIGHFYANWIEVGARGDGERGAPLTPRNEVRRSNGAASWQDPEQAIPIFPCLGLLVSGGHTDLVLFKSHFEYKYLGGTRDDAAGECFDKCARLLNLSYPGGPEISKLAKLGNPKRFNLPIPMTKSGDFDFSFSGLKTAVVNLVNTPEIASSLKAPRNDVIAQQDQRSVIASEARQSQTLSDLCASIEETIVKHIIDKTIKAAQIYKVEQIMVAGGVAANQRLRDGLEFTCKLKNVNCKLFFPPPSLCTDNAAMIASRAFFQKPIKNPLSLQANPNLFF